MRDATPAVARQPDPLTINPAVQVAAATMLLHEGVDGGEQLWHSPSDYFFCGVPTAMV
jgi:hypothetical protein